MTFTDLTLIIPFRTDHGHRQRAFNWCLQRYQALLPRAEIVVHGDDLSAGPFNKARVVNEAVDRTNRRLLLLGDADSVIPTGWAERAADTARKGEWALTRSCHYLTETQTNEMLTCPPERHYDPPDECEYSGTVSWGGQVMLPREAFRVVNGMDERFSGWGPEDTSFGLAMEALWGHHRRLPGAMIHLWHPVADESTWGAPWRDQVRVLHDRYVAAAGNRRAMERLVAGNRHETERS
jgi:hypothetical protein